MKRICTYCGTVYSVVVNPAVLATDTDTVRPLLEYIRATGPNVVMLYRYVIARKGAFCDMQTRPTARIERANVFDKLPLVATAHFDVSATLCRRCPSACSVYLDEQTRRISMSRKSTADEERTWIFRSFTPLQLSPVPSTALVCPVPLNTGPATTKVARSSPVG